MEKEKKEYEKPEIQKHQAVAVVSGSDDCNTYRSRTVGDTYYH